MLIWILSVFLSVSCVHAGRDIIIGSQKVSLTQQTKCSTKSRGWSTIDACTCCILREGYRPQRPRISGKFVKRCIRKNYCGPTDLNLLMSPLQLRNDPENYMALSRALTAESLGVELQKTESAALSTDAQKIKAMSVLQKAIQRRRLSKVANQKSLEEIAKPTEIVTDHLTTTTLLAWLKKASKDKGGFSESIFYVYYHPECNPKKARRLILVIKELKERSAEKELTNLTQLQNSPQLRTLQNFKNPLYPQIVFSEGFYKFKKRDGTPRYLVLIHAARGHSLNQIFKEGTDKQKSEAFKSFGTVLANFNKQFLSGRNCALLGGKSIKSCGTINHGDLHPNNVFFDGKFIYFIDTETLARSLRKPTPLALDLIYFYNLPIYKWHKDYNAYTALFAQTLDSYVTAITKDISLQQEIRGLVYEMIKKENVATRFLKSEYMLIRNG